MPAGPPDDPSSRLCAGPEAVVSELAVGVRSSPGYGHACSGHESTLNPGPHSGWYHLVGGIAR